jgi:cyanophycinase
MPDPMIPEPRMPTRLIVMGRQPTDRSAVAPNRDRAPLTHHPLRAARLGRVGTMAGPLAFVGGGEFSDGCSFDAELLEASGASEVLVVPTAAAYEHPQRLVEQAASWFDRLGVPARGVDLLARPQASEPEVVDALAASRFTYLVGGSPLHLRAVVKDSPAWEALEAAWRAGGVLAGSSAGAMVLCDPMVDPRGGAFTLGLGLVPGLAVIPAHDHWSEDAAHRTRQMSPPSLVLAGIDERTALIRDADGTWRASGAGEVVVFVGGAPAGLDALAGLGAD